MKTSSLCCALVMVAVVHSAWGQPVGTAITYQGVLQEAGAPLEGPADFEFRLWDAPVAGSQIGSVVAVSNETVADGLFTVQIDFGVGAFDGRARWLEIAVRAPAGGGAFSTLGPRQPVTASPYALQTRGIFVGGGDDVGIGTMSPAARLDVRTPLRDVLVLDGASANGARLIFKRNNTPLWDMGFSAVGTQDFYIGDTAIARLVIDRLTGNVGFGTDNPRQRIHNVGDYYGKGHIWLHAIQGDGASGMAFLQARDESTTSSVGLQIRTKNGNSLTDALHITPTGAVGIGTITPADRLHVNGNIRVANGSSILGVGRVAGAAFPGLRLAGDDNPPAGADLTIGADGNAAYGTEPEFNHTFKIRSDGDAVGFEVEGPSGSRWFSVSQGALFAPGLLNIGDFRNMQYAESNGLIGFDTSSRRYKENIQSLTDDFTRVLLMEPKTYTRIGGETGRWEIGYIAEEVQDLGLNRLVEYDTHGRPDGVNYEKMVLYLNEVIKQQQAQIQDLQREVRAMKADLRH